MHRCQLIAYFYGKGVKYTLNDFPEKNIPSLKPNPKMFCLPLPRMSAYACAENDLCHNCTLLMCRVWAPNDTWQYRHAQFSHVEAYWHAHAISDSFTV